MTDETPNRPDEKDDTMNEDDHDPHVPEVTRREAMSTPAKAALGGAGVLGLLGLSTGSASAQQSLEPAQVLRDSQDREIRLRMLDGDLLLEHVPSGATFSYDQSAGSWVLNGTLDADGNDVQNVGSLDATSVSTDELNSTAWTDPDESDFTTALDDALTRVADGGTVIVAPVAYSWSGTTVPLPDKDVRISAPGVEQKGGGGGGGDIDSLYPLVDLGSTDGTVIQVPENSLNQVTISGLTFEGDDTQTANLIEAHAPIASYGVSATNVGTATLIALVTDSGENVNGSKIQGAGARQAGRVVSIEDPGNTNNVNSVKVSIDTAFNMTDSAIYSEGTSSVLEVNVFEGSTSPNAGIDVQGSRNMARVWRNESSAPPIRFGNAANFGEVLYDQSGTEIQYDNSNNRAINYATASSFAELLAGSGGWRVQNAFQIAGDGVLQIEDENGDLVELRADGGELIAEDAAGNTTTLT